MNAFDQTRRSDRNITRILIVDDHPLMREGLIEVLEREPDLKVCGEAEDRFDALAAIEKTKPDLVIADLALKTSHGFDLIKDIAARFPKIRILVVSMHDELINAERAIRAGASGYITKQEATTRILQAVRKALAGEIYLSEKAAVQIAASVTGRRRSSDGIAVSALTDREMQVFQMIGKGQTVRQIAAELHLDVSTIETYRARIKEKLKVKDAVELLQAAIQWNSSQRF
jgi:DNA-binding NarL/FixJ family response regulator